MVVSSPSTSTKVVATAYLSPDESRLTVVLMNVTTAPQSFTLDLSGFGFASSFGFVSTKDASWQTGPALAPSMPNQLDLDAKAIATIVVSKNANDTP
jgi:hypothetical protein